MSENFILFDKGLEITERTLWVMDKKGGIEVSRFHPFDLFDSYDFLAMADFIAFNTGRCIVEDTGWPATVYFDLSSNAVSAFTASTAYASRAPITGTSYANKTHAEPAATGLGSKVFSTTLQWLTGAAVNWTNPATVVATDNSASLFCAWNLVAGGATRDMSQANTTLNVTPTYLPTNPP